MNILIVCSGNRGVSPFITEQGEALKKKGVHIDYYIVTGKGTTGYLKNLKPLIKKIGEGEFDLVHAHYGLSGLLCVLQRKIPTIITFHGTDVNKFSHWVLSLLACRMSSYNIVVSRYMVRRLFLKKRYRIIPCGVDLNTFYPIDIVEARKKVGLGGEGKYILFASAFDKKVKNYPLAVQAVNKLDVPIKIIELKNKSRNEVNLLLNACDLLLLTSISEGSPQIVKEALASNTPVVSTDVGDVQKLLKRAKNCYICSFDPDDVCLKIKLVLGSSGDSEARHLFGDYELHSVATQIKQLYISTLNK